MTKQALPIAVLSKFHKKGAVEIITKAWLRDMS